MIEIIWGDPLILDTSGGDGVRRISTIEQARYWLRRKWPVADCNRDIALRQVDAAMECLAPVDAAKRAFVLAARSAGLRPRAEAARAPLPA